MAAPLQNTSFTGNKELVLALVCVFGLTVYTVFFPVISADSWAYHFPFSSLIYNIGGGKSRFELCQVIADRFDGFPLLSEILQGFFWRITGNVRAVVIPQCIALAGMLCLVSLRMRMPPLLLLASFCMVPLLMMHLVNTNNDLISGLFIFCGLICTALTLEDRGEVKPVAWAAIIGLFALGSATKYQSTLFTSAAFALFVLALVLQRRFRAKHIVWVVVAVAAINAFEIRNLVAHQNPFYPIAVKMGEHTVFAGPEKEYSQMPTYEPKSGVAYFFTSVTEFDWVKRGVVPRYSYAMEEGDRSRTGDNARTGGFGQAFMLTAFSLLLLQAARWRVLDRRQSVLLAISFAAVALTSVMPQALELRYWLYLPMFLCLTCLRFMLVSGLSRIQSLMVMSPFILFAFASSFQGIWTFSNMFPRPTSEYMNSSSQPRDVKYSNYGYFWYSKAITGQNLKMTCEEKK